MHGSLMGRLILLSNKVFDSHTPMSQVLEELTFISDLQKPCRYHFLMDGPPCRISFSVGFLRLVGSVDSKTRFG